ncbi:MAG: hypothetical protein NXI20_03400 [bacterium]|nr:hypothetical protein [bacterium]
MKTLATIFLLFGYYTIFSQNYQEEELLTKLKEEYPTYNISIEKGPTLNYTRYYKISYTTPTNPNPKDVTLKLSYDGKGYYLPKHHRQPSFTGEYISWPGEIYKTYKTDNHSFIITADTTYYGQVQHIKYQLYINGRDWGAELYSIYNVDCESSKNFYTDLSFKQIDKKNHRLTINFELNNCSDEPTRYQWKLNWHDKKNEFTEATTPNKKEINAFANAYRYPEDGMYQVSKFVSENQELNPKFDKLNSSELFIAFEGGKAKFYKISPTLELKGIAGFALDTTDLHYKCKIGEDEFTGQYWERGNQIYIEGYDQKDSYYKLQLLNTHQTSGIDEIKTLDKQTYTPTKEIIWNEIRLGRAEVLKHYKDNKMYRGQEYFSGSNWRTLPDLAVLSGHVDVAKVILDFDDPGYWEHRVKRYAQESRSSEMVKYVDQILTELNDSREADKNKKERDYLNSLQAYIYNQLYIANNWTEKDGDEPDPTIPEVIVSRDHDLEDLQVHNVTLNWESQERTELYNVIHKKIDGRWELEVKSFFLEEMGTGHVKNIFSIEDKIFMYLRNKRNNAEVYDETHQIFLLNTDTMLKEQITLEFTSTNATKSCDRTEKTYYLSFDTISDKRIQVQQTTRTVEGCISKKSSVDISDYRWSNRKEQFIKTLE